MSSAPSELEVKSTLDLAVKYSTWGPAHWLHTKAEVGSSVTMRVGGDFHYPNRVTDAGARHNLLLVAGGVGVNPLASIFTHAAEAAAKDKVGQVKMLYSAKSVQELIFRDKLDAITGADGTGGRFGVKYFVTKETCPDDDDRAFHHGRITSEDLKEQVEALNELPTYCYICGPTGFIQSTDIILQDLGFPKSNIFFELWW